MFKVCIGLLKVWPLSVGKSLAVMEIKLFLSSLVSPHQFGVRPKNNVKIAEVAPLTLKSQSWRTMRGMPLTPSPFDGVKLKTIGKFGNRYTFSFGSVLPTTRWFLWCRIFFVIWLYCHWIYDHDNISENCVRFWFPSDLIVLDHTIKWRPFHQRN